jgi:hypothetical protein
MAKAEQFLALADLAASSTRLRSAEASNLIEAGIAASVKGRPRSVRWRRGDS